MLIVFSLSVLLTNRMHHIHTIRLCKVGGWEFHCLSFKWLQQECAVEQINMSQVLNGWLSLVTGGSETDYGTHHLCFVGCCCMACCKVWQGISGLSLGPAICSKQSSGADSGNWVRDIDDLKNSRKYYWFFLCHLRSKCLTDHCFRRGNCLQLN
jgi:hypothetical protein